MESEVSWSSYHFYRHINKKLNQSPGLDGIRKRVEMMMRPSVVRKNEFLLVQQANNSL